MERVEVAIPGKLMLAGEYAVLKGGASLACTVSSMLSVEATLDASCDDLLLQSDLWRDPLRLSEALASERFQAEPLVQAAKFCRDKYGIRNGVLKIHSELDPRYGVGSSSALRMGMVCAFDLLSRGKESAVYHRANCWDLARDSFSLQKTAQKKASGYDIVTQNLGGLVLMRAAQDAQHWPGLLTKLPARSTPLNHFVHPYVGGRGAPTGNLTQSTSQWLDERQMWPRLMTASEALVLAFIDAVEQGFETVRPKLIDAVCEHRALFWEHPDYPRALLDSLAKLPGFDAQWTCKTTGAGGEDAIILIGDAKGTEQARVPLAQRGWQPAPFVFCETGPRYSHSERPT